MYYIAYLDREGFPVALKEKGRLFYYDNKADAEDGQIEIEQTITEFLEGSEYQRVPILFGLMTKDIPVPKDTKTVFRLRRILETLHIVNLPSSAIYNREELYV